MLDNLLDIEVAYSLLRGGAQDNENDPIDINYDKLKTKIEVRSVDTWIMCKIVYIFLQNNARMVISMHGKWCDMFIPQVVDKATDEAEILMQYVKNTHAATHNTYTLEVQEVSHYWRK